MNKAIYQTLNSGSGTVIVKDGLIVATVQSAQIANAWIELDKEVSTRQGE